MSDKKEKKPSAPAKEVKKSKKPVRPGINSGRMLEQRMQLKLSVGMLARSCDGLYKMIAEQSAKSGKPLDEYGEISRFPTAPAIPFNEKTREVDSVDVSSLKMIERALIAHEKVLNGHWKAIRPARTDRQEQPKNGRKGAPNGRQQAGKAPRTGGKPFAKQSAPRRPGGSLDAKTEAALKLFRDALK